MKRGLEKGPRNPCEKVRLVLCKEHGSYRVQAFPIHSRVDLTAGPSRVSRPSTSSSSRPDVTTKLDAPEDGHEVVELEREPEIEAAYEDGDHVYDDAAESVLAVLDEPFPVPSPTAPEVLNPCTPSSPPRGEPLTSANVTPTYGTWVMPHVLEWTQGHHLLDTATYFFATNAMTQAPVDEQHHGRIVAGLPTGSEILAPENWLSKATYATEAAMYGVGYARGACPHWFDLLVANGIPVGSAARMILLELDPIAPIDFPVAT